MSLSVQNNISAMNAYRNLATTQNNLSSSLEKLSSGFRINRAADDAAGLAISEGLRSQVGGLTVAVRNAQDGISVVQTAEGALTETHAILQRMRDLSVQAANTGGLSEDAKGNIQLEINELNEELDRIATTTKFNGTALLNGTYEGTFQVGANAGEVIDVKVTTDMSSTGLGVDTLDVTTSGNAVALGPGAFDFAATTAPAASSISFGGTTWNLDLGGWDASGSAAAAEKNYNLVRSELAAVSGEVSATVDRFGAVTVNGPSDLATGDVTGTGALADLGTATAATGAGSGGSAAIGVIDTAIQRVSEVRAELGAKQNRLDHTINSLQVSVENLTASESRIRDTDMANEMVAYTSANILQQAGTAMLAQANQLPQSVLSLLR